MSNKTVIRHNPRVGPVRRGPVQWGSRRITGDEGATGSGDTSSASGQGAGPIIVARYADGRPARLSDGSVIRYTAGGRAVRLPAG